MASTTMIRSTRSVDEDTSLAELLVDLRGELIWPLTLIPVGAAYCVLFFAYDYRHPEVWVPALVFAGGAGLAIAVRRWGDTLAAITLIAGLLLGLAAAARVYPATAVPCLFAPVVAIATVLFGLRAGAIVAAGASTLVLALPAMGAVVRPDVASTAMVLIVATLILSWLLTRPLRTALAWSWFSYQESQRAADLLRAHQVELGRVSKSLQETIYRLEVANHELERARQAAEEARRVKAEFAMAISHELRTPLNLIIGFSEMMVMAPQTYQKEILPEGYRGDVEAIYRSACHLSGLIDDVLDLAQVEAHQMGLEKEWVALDRIVEEAVATVATLFKDRGLSLDVAVPADLPPLHVDRTRVRQVLINLLTNAARFTATGGVTISAAGDEREVTVRVRDTGVGIPPDGLASLFTELHRPNASHLGPYGGRGLGLTICRHFVELHGGVIRAESSPGQGSTFSFTLPVSGNVVARPFRETWETWARPAAEEVDAAVAVLTTDEQALSILRRHLQGYHVVDVANAEAALKLGARARLQALVAVDATGQAELTHLDRSSPDLALVPRIVFPLRTHQGARPDLPVQKRLAKPIGREQLRRALAACAKKPTRVAIIDDDPDLVRLLTRMVRSISRRCQIVTATDGRSALELLRRESPQVVLLDLLMPGLSGYDVVEKMRADPRLASVPVIAITAWGGDRELVTVEAVTISRPGGLSIGEGIGYLRAILPGPSPHTSPGILGAPAA